MLWIWPTSIPGHPRPDRPGAAGIGDRSARFVLYFHGGAFVFGNAEGIHRDFAGRLAAGAKCSVLSVDYRRAPEHPFPAASTDAVAAYRWLSDRVEPNRIVVMGDSAGGAVVVELLVELARLGLPSPAAAVLISPWVDLADDSSPSWAARAPGGTDYLRSDLARRFAEAYAGGRSLADVSPARLALEGLPPIHVELGGGECLLDQGLRFVARAEAAGLEVSCHVTPGMPHVFQLFALAGVKPAGLAIARISRRLLELFAAAAGSSTVGVCSGYRGLSPLSEPSSPATESEPFEFGPSIRSVAFLEQQPLAVAGSSGRSSLSPALSTAGTSVSTLPQPSRIVVV